MIAFDSVITGGIILFTIVFIAIKIFRLRQLGSSTKGSSCNGCTSSSKNCCSLPHDSNSSRFKVIKDR